MEKKEDRGDENGKVKQAWLKKELSLKSRIR